MKVGDIYYGIKDLMPYEVIKETGREFYLCRFDGTCSKIKFAQKGKPSLFVENEREAVRCRIFELRQEIRRLEGLLT